MKKLEVTIKELSKEELPRKMLLGIKGGYIGKYKKEKGERTPSKTKPLILINYDYNILALAKVRKFYSEETNPRKEVEYLVEHIIQGENNSAYTLSKLIDFYSE
jgi:hypothetical protein